MIKQLALRLWRDRSGAFAPISALLLIVILGFGALAVDMGYAYIERSQLQATADATALTGALQLPDQTEMVNQALVIAEANMAATKYGTVLANADIQAGNWDPATRTFVAGLAPINAVQTTTRRQVASGNPAPSFLGGIFGISNYDVAAASIATQGVGEDLFPSGCIMSLSETEEDAFYIFGTATITATACSIEVASDHECAMHAHGTPTVTYVDGDGSISVAGGYCENGSVDIDPPPDTDYQGDVDDPYRNTDPCQTGLNCSAPCDYTDATFTDSAVAPAGVYCGGITWTGSGTATFAGDYIIREGALNIGGNVAIDGSGGVGFYLQGAGSVVDFGGTSDMTLVAQDLDSGSALAGFIFFEEEKSPKESHTLRGTNSGGYDGVLYFTGDVELKGTADSGSGGTTDCTVLIADTLYFNGTTGLDADSTCAGDGPGLPPGVGDLVVRLVN